MPKRAKNESAKHSSPLSTNYNNDHILTNPKRAIDSSRSSSGGDGSGSDSDSGCSSGSVSPSENMDLPDP